MKTSLLSPLKAKFMEIYLLLVDPVEPVMVATLPIQPEPSEDDKLYHQMEAICCQFHPVFFTRDNQYYMLIDSQNCVQVDLDNAAYGAALCDAMLTYGLYTLAVNRELELKGFEIIAAAEFHCHYTAVQNTLNLKVNPALQRALTI